MKVDQQAEPPAKVSNAKVEKAGKDLAKKVAGRRLLTSII